MRLFKHILTFITTVHRCSASWLSLSSPALFLPSLLSRRPSACTSPCPLPSRLLRHSSPHSASSCLLLPRLARCWLCQLRTAWHYHRPYSAASLRSPFPSHSASTLLGGGLCQWLGRPFSLASFIRCPVSFSSLRLRPRLLPLRCVMHCSSCLLALSLSCTRLICTAWRAALSLSAGSLLNAVVVLHLPACRAGAT